jgi:membrane associated rhomboid family serine protease
MAITLVLMLMAGAAGYLIGDYKRRPVLGAVVGFLFGLLGIAAVMLVPRRRVEAVDARAAQDVNV